MKWRIAAIAAVACVVPLSLKAQRFEVGVQAAAATHGESSEARNSSGIGVGGFFKLRRGSIRIEGRAYRISMDPDLGTDGGFDLTQVDLRASYRVFRSLELEVGAGRRYAKPDFVTQEIGTVTIGLRTETTVSAIADVWARGAYHVLSKFSGGGSHDLGFDVGLGARFATPSDRVKLVANYEFRRIDRTVNQRDVPIQLSVAMVGLALIF